MSFTTSISRLRRLGVLGGVVMAALAAGPATASADEFSKVAPHLVAWDIPFKDCWVTVGPVHDPGTTSENYRTIGGARVSPCVSRHRSIAVTVREYASDGTRVWEVGNGVGTTFTNSYGFGDKILELNLGCTGRRYSWRTGAYVTIDGQASGWLFSPWSGWKNSGC